jgi:ATP-dependent RNA helicase DeaD
MVDDLVEHLNAQGYSADRLHGEMTQAMRDRVMNRFRKSGLEFLVATDVAARGIDVEDIEVVFNYDLPYDGEDYVHRIGRTGRQGRSGRAISFASGREVFQIRSIERYTNTRILRGRPPTVVEVEEARANVVLEKIRSTLRSGDYKRQDQLIERLLEEGFSSTDIASALLHHLQGGEDGPGPEPVRKESPVDRDRPERGQARRERVGDRRVSDRGGPSPRHERSLEPRRHESGRPTAASSPSPPPPAKQEGEPRKEDSAAAVIKPSRAERVRHENQAAVHERSRDSKRRPTPEGQTRLFINVGADMGIVETDVVGAILGATGLPRHIIGEVDIRDRHLFVKVASEHAPGIIAKLNRAQIKGRKAKVKVA